MKKIKWLPLVLALVFAALCLSGCGSSNAKSESYAYTDEAYYEPTESDWYNEAYDDGGLSYDMPEPEATEYEADAPSAQNDNLTGEVQNKNLKLIYTVNLTVETLDYDKSVEAVESLTEQFGGYVEYAQVDNNRINSKWMRNASYTLRIPADSLDAFLASCGAVGNVCSSERRTENRTTEYMDLSSRLETLKIEEESLQELLANADELDAIVALHEYLSDVRYEIERVETRMRGIDGLVSYSTVYLNLEEVKVVTETVTTKSTFGERLSARLSSSWSDFVDSLENFGVFALGELPLILLTIIVVLLPFAIVVFVIIVIIRSVRKKKRAKREAAQMQTLCDNGMSDPNDPGAPNA